MFEDLTKGTNKYKSYEEDYKDKCPYCGSYNIEKGSTKSKLDDTWERDCVCNACHRRWTFHFTEDFSKVYAEVEKPNRHEVFK